ncbi:MULTISPECIES: hydantoinase B/oxoprolinase family protein [unclassified Sphingomonas]|uniref:hydantoinase B/oxoprolinase family protein n=1 Tax=unclassified Sphingomonas TaxID=196159 RepID=UPI0006FA0D30|nr:MULTISPECIES: hydantoinase B/oxoprolinase family protein [unclassified Sphingomonas]KQX25076.1 5-oxoprolinase [Sphingomonas sp. Root1294]KQY66093.1 5-oxoprolinase [Sphingomonas sp. Root50]KRB89743.1 5-oxoprolinase [Sphingomonas sp. Root720]
MRDEALKAGWHFWIDRGGTFTDIVALTPERRIATRKLLSSHPERYADAAIQGIRDFLGLAAGDAIPAERISSVKMGTTVATNALLERQGEPVALVTTLGFRDMLRIGYQNRPRLFDRHIVLPDRLERCVIEARERVDAEGRILLPLDTDHVAAELRDAFAAGCTAVAIVLMHGYRFPDHEDRIAEIARGIGFTQVSVSNRVSPLMKIVSRGDTTLVDAYLSPVLGRYVRQVAEALGDGVPLAFMQSNGGLIGSDRFRGRDAILSGPAGGIVGMVRTAEAAGFGKVIGFDMGGTSTDVSHYAGTFERTLETVVAGVRLRVPMMSIDTIAAGGGSICRFDGTRLRVGPESAGADPGPACYRRGGPLTITDCNVLLGKLQPDCFPKLFGAGGNEPIDAAVVRRRFEALAEEVAAAGLPPTTPEALAEGFLAIAVDSMANAIKKISVARGHDVADYVLACFGGAAGQHACLVADALGMSHVMIHPLAGVLSAYGIGLADQRIVRHRAMEVPLAAAALAAAALAMDALEGECRARMGGDGFDRDGALFRRSLLIRYQGTDTGIEIDEADEATLRQRFERRYRQRFTFSMPDVPLLIESVAVELIVPSTKAGGAFSDLEAPSDDGRREARLFAAGGEHAAPVLARRNLRPGDALAGPAIIHDSTATVVVEPGWSARVADGGDLILSRTAPREQQAGAGGAVLDPVRLEIFNNLFMAIAEQMGQALQNSAQSVNIKERLDFSCALFDGHGALVANAPHMPVHLGSMGDSVRAVRDAAQASPRGLRPGDAYLINNPYNGGTHLPDLTVVMPVFDEEGGCAFYVAARGHHADIGGRTPGSMPPDSRTLDEEGVLFDAFPLVEEGILREAAFRAKLASGRWPARDPDRNVGDIRAQIAACARGVDEIGKMVAQYGRDTVTAYMRHVQDNAAEAVRRVLDRIGDGAFTYELDDGSHVSVAIRVDRTARRAVIDFTGTSVQQPSNFNAPPSICRAAVLYVMRTLVDEDIPMNDGCLEPIDIVIPEGSMLRPAYPAALVAGNVETSQVITDALYGATGTMAAAQGTMNNFTFGDDRYQYYETIGGGSGAGPGFAGTSAVQTHMTNSRLTDPEVLEWRFPVLLEAFEVRHGSGGAGRHRGGDGIHRRIRFLRPMTATILSNRRRVPPFGLEGGEPGQPGRNSVRRADGSVEEVGSRQSVEMREGDAFVIDTPGGGGFGRTG